MSENEAVRLTVFRLSPKDALPSIGALPVVTDENMVRQVDITTPRLLTAAGAVVREFVPPDRMEQLLTALEKGVRGRSHQRLRRRRERAYSPGIRGRLVMGAGRRPAGSHGDSVMFVSEPTRPRSSIS